MKNNKEIAKLLEEMGDPLESSQTNKLQEISDIIDKELNEFMEIYQGVALGPYILAQSDTISLSKLMDIFDKHEIPYTYPKNGVSIAISYLYPANGRMKKYINTFS
jgi:hypothetical protein